MEDRTYFEKEIKDITKKDANVAVTGFIISKNEGSFILGDKTEQIQVISDTDLDINTFVRLFARVIPYEEGPQLQANIIQDLSKIDKFLYNKVRKLIHG